LIKSRIGQRQKIKIFIFLLSSFFISEEQALPTPTKIINITPKNIFLII